MILFNLEEGKEHVEVHHENHNNKTEDELIIHNDKQRNEFAEIKKIEQTREYHPPMKVPQPVDSNAIAPLDQKKNIDPSKRNTSSIIIIISSSSSSTVAKIKQRRPPHTSYGRHKKGSTSKSLLWILRMTKTINSSVFLDDVSDTVAHELLRTSNNELRDIDQSAAQRCSRVSKRKQLGPCKTASKRTQVDNNVYNSTHITFNSLSVSGTGEPVPGDQNLTRSHQRSESPDRNQGTRLELAIDM